jgi:hypothetical protein
MPIITVPAFMKIVADPDPQHFRKSDPDPRQSDNADTDPHHNQQAGSESGSVTK